MYTVICYTHTKKKKWFWSSPQAGYAIAVVFAVPVIAVLLLTWTLVGFLCSLGGIPAFLLVAALLISSGFADTAIGNRGNYAFDSSLLGEKGGRRGVGRG